MEIILGSERALNSKMEAVLKDFAPSGGKVKVICRCQSMDDANKKAKTVGLGDRWFMPDCCAEVREKYAVDLLKDDVEMAICVDGNNFLAIDSDVRDMLLR
ncbi:MAG: hypothetical protein FWC75_09700 [Oscillospiraceae bacterium]|nr:hypothetical protein [Oscillospiraceae bacterium]